MDFLIAMRNKKVGYLNNRKGSWKCKNTNALGIVDWTSTFTKTQKLDKHACRMTFSSQLFLIINIIAKKKLFFFSKESHVTQVKVSLFEFFTKYEVYKLTFSFRQLLPRTNTDGKLICQRLIFRKNQRWHR